MVPEPIAIHVKDVTGVSRKLEPIQLGVPFAKGTVTPHSSFYLSDAESEEAILVQTRPLAHWPDGSVRWLKVNFLVNLAATKKRQLHLRVAVNEEEHPSASSLQYESHDNEIHINTGLTKFCVVMDKLCWSAQATGGAEINHTIKLFDFDGNECESQPDSGWQVVENGPVCLTLATMGSWQKRDEGRLANFDCRLHFYANSDTAKLEVCIHNPKRAKHPGGLWDLGDPGSVYFRSLSIKASHPTSEQAWLKPEPSAHALTEPADKRLYLYQDSSGGENWHSRNHVNAEGKVTTRFRGYKTQADTLTVTSGDRAQPSSGLKGSSGQVQASIHQFWQNFPSSLGTNNRNLIVGLFPDDASEPYELQGGERKLHTVWLNYSDDNNALDWTHSPVVPTLDADHYEKADAFPWFRANQPKTNLDQLINEGLEGPRNFFAKREMIDEYGWRNFGDIFADHETLYQKEGEQPFISHYNNQYDAIYGFARQFALSGDLRWFELMDDLARHVADIDIYHTEEDRSEYNNGLFWHTDHYLDAHTATHRTFSRHNSTSSTPGQTGGGPAEEHCYTTGLLYHYFLTGNTASRQAVLDLATWMTNLHEGDGTFLEELLRIKRYDVPKIESLLAREAPTRHVYLFNRGTGNYLNALLDAHILEPERHWLEKAENVIYGTIHPNDQISNRKLLEAETGWSYLVLVGAISRFLIVKDENKVFDGTYEYVATSLCHYTRWMLSNEQTYLSQPEELEFANDTWAAQDIRKSMIFFQAARWDPEIAEDYRAKAVAFLDYVVDTLDCSPERSFARVQVILLQNYGPHQTKISILTREAYDSIKTQYDNNNTPFLTWPSLVRRIIGRLARSFRGFRLTKELKWLSIRLDSK